MKKYIKLLILLFLIGTILFFVFNPFYWLMKSSAEKQPSLSKQETYFINKLKDDCKCEVERFFENIKDKKGFFNYSLSFEGTTRNVLRKKDNNKIIKEILDSILPQKKEFLNEIQIYRTFVKKNDNIPTSITESSFYKYDASKDTMINFTKKHL